MTNSTSPSRQTTSDSSLIDPAARHQFGLLKWLIEWTFSTKQKLRQSEKVLLSNLKTPYQAYFVDIGNIVDVDGSEQIWTLSLNIPQTDECRVPLVVLHGVGMGLGMWYQNFDDLANHRRVYAIDILGFGRSIFSAQAELCECQLVTALEEWRQQLNITEMILLGHSFGAYIASCYALTYPNHVKHLILSDEWGYEEEQSTKGTLFQKSLNQIDNFIHPYWFMRSLGPLANLHQIQSSPSLVTEYAEQCNGGSPSGLGAFHAISKNLTPLLPRIVDLPNNIGITFIYGERTGNGKTRSGIKVQKLRPNFYVDVMIIPNSGYYICMERPQLFNKKVCEICESIES